MKQRIYIIVGPTASGKSDAAIKLAKKMNGEIISCDSMQIYKDMQVITQAVTKKEMKDVPHHLIAVLKPEKEYSAAEFSEEAGKLIKKIIKAKKTPIITGGTGFYIKALIDGLFPSPQKDESFRTQMMAHAQKYGTKRLHDDLKKVDKQSAAGIHANDLKRIIRALEIYYVTGIPKSKHIASTKGIGDNYDIVYLGINVPREELYEKINKRVNKMFKNGLVAEVKKLNKRKLSVTAKLALGIRQVNGHLEGLYSLEDAKEQLRKDTRRYAKRQMTWFRQDKRIVWFKSGKDVLAYCKKISTQC